MMAKRKPTAWLITLGLLLSHSVMAQSRDAATLVVTAPVQFEHETRRFETVGTAEAIKSVVVYPAVSDKVTSVNFAPGQRVTSGQVLLKLDARRQQVAVDRAKIQLADAQRTVKRLQQSSQQGAIAQSALDDAITARDLLQVQLTEANTELADRTVLAPFDGVVGLTDVEAGDRITELTAITTIDNRQQLLINFTVPEDALQILRSNPEVSVQPWQNRQVTHRASITEIDSRINDINRSIRVRALLNNDDDLYRPGMSFRVQLEMTLAKYAVIPEAALLWGPTSAYVWVVDQQRARKVDVQIRQRLSGRLLVSGDLTEQSILITEGVQSLRESQKIRTANEQETTL